MIRAVRVFFLLVTFLASAASAGVQTLWTQRFTSGAITYSIRIAKFDSAGHLVIAGEVTEANTAADIWVAKLNKDTGAVMWTFRKDGAIHGNDKVGNIVLSPEDDVYVAGAVTNGSLGPTTPDTDMYLARLKASDGTFVWERSGFENPGVDGILDVALDADANLVITGMLENVETVQGSDVWTAKLDKTDAGIIWDNYFKSFDGFIQDQGERLFIAPNGDVYVQGFTEATNVGGVAVPPGVLALSYDKDGQVRFARRFKEGQNARAFGFIPNVNGGFIMGVSVTVGNTPIHSVVQNRVDGSPGLEVALPGVSSAPLVSVALDNGEVLYSGRGPVGSVPPPIVSGRLAATDFSTVWTKQQPAQAVGQSTPFGHNMLGTLGTVVAGISQGANTPDLVIAPYSKTGTAMGATFVDGAASGAETTEQLPGALATDASGEIGVVFQLAMPTGGRETVARRLRVTAAAGSPTVAIVKPSAANPNVDAFTDFVFTAAATDPEGGPVSVEFFADGVSIGVDTTAPFEVTHRFQTTGTHTLSVAATDSTGLVGTSGPLTVVAHVPTPSIVTGGAERTGPSTGAFHGTVSNLPLGGTARFLFQFSGPSIGFTMSTGTISLAANAGAQPVSIPFTFPEPHRSYDYFLEVTATDGSETITAAGPAQAFLIPNAPIVPAADFVFNARGAIVGSANANDADDDAGEALTVNYGAGPYPGTLVVNGNNFSFTPNRTFEGELVINYTVDDGHGSSTSETLVIRNGLFYAGNYRALAAPTSPRLGAVDVTVNPLGRATAVFYLDGVRYAAAGELKQQFNNHVGFSVVVKKRNEPDKLLRLSWAEDRAFTAALIESDSTLFNADGVRAGVSAFALPQVYTMLGTHSNVSGPAGGRVSAFASLRLPPDGKATFRGKLGDGTAFVTTARVQEDGRLPIFAPIAGRRGSFVVGRLQVNANDAATISPGLAAVMGPGSKSIPAYAADYRDLVTFSGPLFAPTPAEPPLTFTANPRRLTLSVSGGGQDGLSFDLPVWVSRSGGVNGITGITRFSLNPLTGELNGAFLPTGARRTISFSGIIRPGTNSALGVFRGAPSAGEVTISPQ